MSKPTPGKQYTTLTGDTYRTIAEQAYGDGKFWRNIYAANQTEKGASLEDVPVGVTLNVPELPQDVALKTKIVESDLLGKDPDEITLVLDGLEITPLSARVSRTADSLADGWAVIVPWEPGEDKQFDSRISPFAYTPAAIYVGGILVVNGVLYTTTPRIDNDGGRVVELIGWSFAADVIDSTLRPPYEQNNITLEQRASDLVKPLGISVEVEGETGGIFDRVTANQTETIFTHLVKLATQRGKLITSTRVGNVLITEAATGQPVGTLEESQPLPIGWSAKFDGRKRFNTYRAIGQSPGDNAKVALAIDKVVPRSRFYTFQADETTSGNIQDAANWRRSKQVADTLTIPFPVSSFYAPNGELWQENTLVSVKSATIFVPDGFTFLIRAVEYVLDGSGAAAVLYLVPPGVYTKQEIEEPWT